MDHDFSAYEIFKARGPYGGDGPGIFNSLIIGYSEISKMIPGREQHVTPTGANIPLAGYTMENVTFINFGTKAKAIMARHEEIGEAMNPTRVLGLNFVNTTNRVFNTPKMEQGTWLRDIDGTLTGKANSHLVTKSDTNPQELCEDDTTDGLGKGTLDMMGIPIPPPTVPSMRPENALRWSNTADWESIGMTPPSTNEDVTIPGNAMKGILPLHSLSEVMNFFIRWRLDDP